MKSLIVDDARVVRLALRGIMQQLGWQVVEAENGKQAMEQLQRNHDIGLILLDWHMPVMNGYDFLVSLRASPEYVEEPKVIMVTTEASMPSILKAISAGANEYIMKPFDADMIQEKLGMLGLPV
ncbi:MAG TPA: response regulator [Mariprofundaceae bacterium]|nr:response regulator [Mariprofundaceae bacterium]